ncbi:MAG: hypothetical protein ACLQNE_17395 [Thermoguttaceae bacterium]
MDGNTRLAKGALSMPLAAVGQDHLKGLLVPCARVPTADRIIVEILR